MHFPTPPIAFPDRCKFGRTCSRPPTIHGTSHIPSPSFPPTLPVPERSSCTSGTASSSPRCATAPVPLRRTRRTSPLQKSSRNTKGTPPSPTALRNACISPGPVLRARHIEDTITCQLPFARILSQRPLLASALSMLTPCDEHARYCSRQMPFPRNYSRLRQHPIKNSAVQKQNRQRP